MSNSQLLLPNFADRPDTKGIPEIRMRRKRFLSPITRTDLSQYVSLQKNIAGYWYGLNEPRNRTLETTYMTLLASYQAYGAGYVDAAKRYRNDALFEISRQGMLDEDDETDTVRLRFSRTALFYFSTFAVLVVVSIFAAGRGYFLSSPVTVELAIFSFAGSMCAGLAWLKQAEADLRRVRHI